MKNSITTLKPAKKFFTQNGKPINQVNLDAETISPHILALYERNAKHYFKKDEQITSILDLPESEPITSLFEKPVKENLFLKYASKVQVTRKMMLTLVAAVLPIAAFFTFVDPVFSMARPDPKYAIFSSKPLTVAGIEENLESGDSRAAKLNGVFRAYNCPNFEGMGNVFVREADKNNIPYWLVAAVSFQESDCGNITPQKDGNESYNAYGWGVWGSNVKTFDTWEHGIEIVSAYMNKNFYSRGVTDLCEIMKTYTPPSKGSWCAGVEHFRDVITGYETP